MSERLIQGGLLLAALTLFSGVVAAELSGSISIEYRYFFVDMPAQEPPRQGSGLVLEPRYSQAWLNGDLQLDAEGFWRGGSGDEERDHGDIRVLSLNYAARAWELRAGVRRVFWGVTESQHLVDIINQTDQLEGIDGEDKLGQPMLNLALIGGLGTLDFFVLPGFRERDWPATRYRLGPGLRVLSDQTVYESADEDRHVDYALRYGVTLGDWDLGLSWFRGTGREPWMEVRMSGLEPVLVPNYLLIEQVGLDLQATLDNWLWKLEAIHRSGFGDDYAATTVGLEYSFFDIGGSGTDLGLILEHLYDNRGKLATTPFEDDVMVGMRLALNDVQSSEALFGVIKDLDSAEYLVSLELSRRLGQQWKLSVEAYGFREVQQQSLLSAYDRDDFAQLNLYWYF